MPAIPKTLISEAEYLELERKALCKSGYYKGEIFAMAGASISHNKIVASVIGAIVPHYSFIAKLYSGKQHRVSRGSVYQKQ